ncbi:hypothetical protein GCM10023320_47670 [Pseudonocardia adelaidensis]|uniref:Uncharacterized protein n=2 Tax=Pseudonocardia adelaidensis TaxID=648754 RepID=A0ABP9NUV6_9PSEU
MRAAGIAAGSAVVAAGLFLGSGTAMAAPVTTAPVAATATSGGGTGGDACAQLPASMQDLLCPSADAEDQGSSDSGSGDGGGAAAGGTGGGSASSAPTGGTAGTAATPAAPGSGAAAPGGPVSNFLTWLAGLFQYIGL